MHLGFFKPCFFYSSTLLLVFTHCISAFKPQPHTASKVEVGYDAMYTEFSCDANEYQKECISKFMHEDPCVNDKYNDGCLKDKYRNCYDIHGTEGANYCDNPFGTNCDGDGHCIGVGDLMATYPLVPLSVHQDTFAIPVNMKPHVNVDKSSEPVTVCKNSWEKDIFGSTNPYDFYPCVSVAYDVASMRGYSVEGFGVNYCGENKAQFNDKLEKTCFWGGIAGAVAVSALSGGVTGTVIVPVAIGSGSIACEKFANMKGKWPHDQH
jgi:hypothetical protein